MAPTENEIPKAVFSGQATLAPLNLNALRFIFNATLSHFSKLLTERSVLNGEVMYGAATIVPR